MNNNGASLVLASMTLAGHPAVIPPIILYSLAEHLGAGAVDAMLSRTATPIMGNLAEQVAALDGGRDANS
jgi:hypothetical protein